MSRSASVRARAGRDAVYGRETVWAPTPEESAARDRRAREAHGVPGRVLMENAGRAAALILDRLFPAGPVVGLVGAGDNGGDALVLLRTLAAWGRDVAWIAAGSRPPDDALRHAHEVSRIDDPASARAALASAAVVVDGILGT
ncbi:MAG: NAD(P)H-hydrate epimerase, partial [Longimicrobiales bacterium]